MMGIIGFFLLLGGIFIIFAGDTATGILLILIGVFMMASLIAKEVE